MAVRRRIQTARYPPRWITTPCCVGVPCCNSGYKSRDFGTQPFSRQLTLGILAVRVHGRASPRASPTRKPRPLWLLPLVVEAPTRRGLRVEVASGSSLSMAPTRPCPNGSFSSPLTPEIELSFVLASSLLPFLLLPCVFLACDCRCHWITREWKAEVT